MLDDMLGKVVKKLVALPDETLGSVYDLLVKMENPGVCDAVKKLLRGENPFPNAGKVLPAWLNKVGEFSLPGSKEFSASAFSEPGFWPGSNFKAKFGNHKENKTPAEKFIVIGLDERKTGKEILNAIGWDKVVGLGRVHQAAKLNELKKDGAVYIFFVQSQVDNEIQVVVCYWRSDCHDWDLFAGSLSDVWDLGYRVVLRGS